MKNKGKKHKIPTVSTSSQSKSKQELGRKFASVRLAIENYGDSVDLEQIGTEWITTCCKVLIEPIQKSLDVSIAKEAGLLLLRLLERFRPHGKDFILQSAVKLKLEFKMQHMIARALVQHLKPTDSLHLPCLLALRQLLTCFSGSCTVLKKEIEQSLKHWLNASPVNILEDHLYTPGTQSRLRTICDEAYLLYRYSDVILQDSEKYSCSSVHSGKCTSFANCCDAGPLLLAADCWALLPATCSTDRSSVDFASLEQVSSSRNTGSAVALGTRLEELLHALDDTLDVLLSDLITQQNWSLVKKPSNVAKFEFVVEEGKTVEDEAEFGDIELSATRCYALMVFVQQFMAITKRCNCAFALQPNTLLSPLSRILQLSTSSLYQYSSSRILTLARLWPSLQHRALKLLCVTLSTADGHMMIWNTTIVRLLAEAREAAQLSATDRTHQKREPMEEQKTLSLQHVRGSGRFRDAVAQQETVYLIYTAVLELFKSSKGFDDIPVSLLKHIHMDLDPQPSRDATLKVVSKESIANIAIKKKSKRKGYTVVREGFRNKGIGSDANLSVAASMSSQPNIALSVTKSAEIVERICELLSLFARFGPKLEASAARSIMSMILRQGRYFITTSGNICGQSLSGLVDMRIFNRDDIKSSFFRLIPYLVTNPHPTCVLHTTALQFILIEGRRKFAHKQSIYSACHEGLQTIISFIEIPGFAHMIKVCKENQSDDFSNLGSSSISNQNGQTLTTVDCPEDSLQEQDEMKTLDADNIDEDYPEYSESESERTSLDNCKGNNSPRASDSDVSITCPENDREVDIAEAKQLQTNLIASRELQDASKITNKAATSDNNAKKKRKVRTCSVQSRSLKKRRLHKELSRTSCTATDSRVSTSDEECGLSLEEMIARLDS